MFVEISLRRERFKLSEVKMAGAFNLTAIVFWLICAAPRCCQALDADLFKVSPFYGLAAIASRQNFTGYNGECADSLRKVAKGIESHDIWAIKLLDASGSPANRLHWGFNRWFGSRIQCLLSPEDINLSLSPNQSPPPPPSPEDLSPFAVGYYAAYFRHFSDLQLKIKWDYEDVIGLTLCLPASCGEEELALYLQTYFDSGQFYFQKLYNTNLEVTFVKNKTSNLFFKEIPTFILLVVVISTIFLGLAAVFSKSSSVKKRKDGQSNAPPLDINRNTGEDNPTKEENKNKQFSHTTHNETSDDYLKCFDVSYNFSLIKSTQQQNLMPEINGVRAIAMFYVIFGHCTLFMLNYADTQVYSYYMTDYFALQFISNAQIVVDTFFTISAFLTSYSYFRKLGEKKSSFGLKDFALRVVKRYLRLIPLYLVAILLSTVYSSFQYHYSPFLDPDRNDLTCPKYWWRNVLFINNLFSKNEMCLSWSWFISAEMQFYIISLLICVLYSRYGKAALGILGILLAGAVGLSGYIPYKNGLYGTLDDFNQNLLLIYFGSWVHFGASAVGFLLGYALAYVKQNNIKLNKTFVEIGWVIGPLMCLTTLFGLYNSRMGPAMFAIYMALGRVAWGLGISWILFACLTGNGGGVSRVLSKDMWYPLSVISYGSYLINPLVMFVFYGQNDAAWPLMLFPAIVLAAGFMVLVPLISLVLTLFFEIPYCRVVNVLLEKALKTGAKQKRS